LFITTSIVVEKGWYYNAGSKFSMDMIYYEPKGIIGGAL